MILTQKTKFEDMEVGDYITCRYATTSGAVGIFSELGTCTATEIPVTSSATPNGLFNFIKVTPGLLIADRVVQHSISWDTLNAKGLIEGALLRFYDNNICLNYDNNKEASSSVPIVFNNELYIVWQESNGTAAQIRIKKWNGTTWISADNNTSLNYNTTRNAYYAVPIVFNNELYITWIESNTSNIFQIRVKKWDGTAWVTVDNNVGLNYDSTKTAQYPTPIVFNNELYITWKETSGTTYQVRVKKWSGTAWVTADNNSGLNYTLTYDAMSPNPKVFNNELYITWHEYNGTVYLIRVKKWNGTAWVSADNNAGLNYNTAKVAQYPTMEVFNNELYIIWYERNDSSIDQIRVKKFNGTTWVTADNNLNLNYDTTGYATYPNMRVFNNELYAIWQESVGTISRIRIKKLSGTAWVTADNNISLNYDATKSAIYATTAVFNNELYITWSESNGSINQIRAISLQNSHSSICKLRSLSGGMAYADANGNYSSADCSKGIWPTINEWEKYIINNDLNGKITKGDNNIWHWNNISTRCKETIGAWYGGGNTNRVRRGYSSVDRIMGGTSDAMTSSDGFRPVLEYLDPTTKATTLWY